MIFFPVSTSCIQSLARATKEEIARRVAKKVYQELKNDSFLESAYVFQLANEIAREAIGIEFVRLADHDAYTVKVTND